MGIYIYYSVDKKEVSINENNDIKAQTTENSIENTVQNTEVENSTNNIFDDNNVTNTNTNTKTTEYTDKIVEDALEEYLELKEENEKSPASLLEELDLIEDEHYFSNKAGNDGYVKTDIQYSNYKNAMLRYVSEKLFDEKFTQNFQDKNGTLYFLDKKGTSFVEYDIRSVKNNGNNSYTADVYVENLRQNKTIEFSIENYNGRCVINSCSE